MVYGEYDLQFVSGIGSPTLSWERAVKCFICRLVSVASV